MKRVLKIYEQSMGGGSYTPVPTLLLKGKWLEECGFKAGEYVEVNVEGDSINIVKTNPPEKATKQNLHEKIDSMTAEQKRKLEKFIEEM